MSLRWVIAGGGTGGHFFSGVAIADAIRDRDADSAVVFVGTRQGIEGRSPHRERHDVRYISISGIKGKSLGSRLVALARLPVALVQSLAILAKVRPHVVIGVGGYASGPLLVAARMLFIRTAVMEQNSVPGYTNTVLARFVDRIFVGFPGTEERFPPGKAVYTGNPLRLGVVELLTAGDGDAAVGPDENTAAFHLLVFGGSQGAHSINVAMVAAAPAFSAGFRGRLRLVHQTGKADLEEVRAGYAAAGIQAEVVPFIDDMAAAYRRAGLVVCRSGALTVAELTVARRPAVLIPFPFAIYNHQELNARALADHGAARLLLDGDLDGERLAREIETLAEDPVALREMAQRATALGRPRAGNDVVERCEALVRPLRRRTA